MADEVTINVDSTEFRKAIELLARRNNVTKEGQLNRTMYFAARRTWEKVKPADAQKIRTYFGQTGTRIGKYTKAGEFKAFKQNRRLTFSRTSIAQKMAIIAIRKQGKKLSKTSIETVASRIVNRALRGINYLRAGWADIGRKAARASNLFASFPKMPFIRARNDFIRATKTSDFSQLTYRVLIRPKGSKEKRSYISPEVASIFEAEFRKSAQQEIDKYRQLTGRDIDRIK
jgi:hypothetical protein